MQAPKIVRREVLEQTSKLETVRTDLAAKLNTLEQQHGPDANHAYTPDVYQQAQRELRIMAVEQLPQIAEVLGHASETLHSREIFSRESVMARAKPLESRASDKHVSAEMQPMVDELRRLFARAELSDMATAVRSASDEQLSAKYAQMAIHRNDPALAAVVSDTATSRGGIVAVTVGKVLDRLELPEANEHALHLAQLEPETKDLAAAWSDLRSGEKSTRTRMNESVQKNREFAAQQA